MAHIKNLPISFRFLKVPVTWELRTLHSPRLGPVSRLCGQPKEVELESVSFSELDGWQCRDEFLSLRSNDIDALRGFLNKVGIWDPHSGASDIPYWPIRTLRIEPNNLWEFREDIKTALIYPQNFMAQVMPKFPAPKTLLDLVGWPHPANDFRLSFELTEVAVGTVTVTNARHMLLATVLVDIARGIRFKSCKRKDCGKPFPVESEHSRKYCSQYCGHLESVRRKRWEAKKAKGKKS